MNISDLKTVLRAIKSERYATAEVMLETIIREEEDSSYPDVFEDWKVAKENVA